VFFLKKIIFNTETAPFASGIFPKREKKRKILFGGHRVAQRKLSEHDFHDVRIGRMCMSNHVHQANQENPVQTISCISGKKVSNPQKDVSLPPT